MSLCNIMVFASHKRCFIQFFPLDGGLELMHSSFFSRIHIHFSSQLSYIVLIPAKLHGKRTWKACLWWFSTWERLSPLPLYIKIILLSASAFLFYGTASWWFSTWNALLYPFWLLLKWCVAMDGVKLIELLGLSCFDLLHIDFTVNVGW